MPPENSVANLTKSVKHYSFLSFYMLECIHDIIFEYKYKGGTIMVYIESPSTNPAFNLALEQYVFDRMDRSQEYFMLWQNDNTVVIGKNQNAFAEVNQKVADAKHISVVRRLSGGGAVYHDLGNLNFTFILDAKDATDLDIRLFCQPIAELLRSLNVPAEVNGRNDISIEGKKFSGNSQYLKQGRIMHHGTLMFHSDLSVVADVLNVSADKFQSKAAKSVKARVTNIAPYLPEGFTLAQFKALLLKYILKEENVQPYVFSAEELAEVEKIKRERYDKWEWNYGFSPSYSVEKSRRFEGCGKIEVHMNTEDGSITDLQFFGDFFGRGNGGGRRREMQTPKRQASGSGVIISTDGYIVTNNHVVDGADELTVKLNDNREFKARIIGQDKTTDLALIKVEENDLPAIKIGSSDNLKLGEWVLAVGNPFNLTSTVTAGIVSAKARSMGANGVESFIQTDAAINPGNSGGALVNTSGELVGINAMIYSQTGSYAGYGFAIPTTIMNKVVNDLKKFGTVQRAIIGVLGMDVSNYIDVEKEKGNDVDFGTVNGVYISEVTEGSAAADAGLTKGDVITAVDGKQISKMSELQEIVSMHRPGDKISITYMRNKKSQTKSVTLKNAQGTTEVVQEVDVNDMGIGLTPLSNELKRQLRLSYGLEVTAIKDGAMKDAGLQKGVIIMQVNDKQMRTRTDFDEAVKAANMSNDRTLWIRAITKSGIKRSYTVDLSKNDE